MKTASIVTPGSPRTTSVYKDCLRFPLFLILRLLLCGFCHCSWHLQPSNNACGSVKTASTVTGRIAFTKKITPYSCKAQMIRTACVHKKNSRFLLPVFAIPCLFWWLYAWLCIYPLLPSLRVLALNCGSVKTARTVTRTNRWLVAAVACGRIADLGGLAV